MNPHTPPHLSPAALLLAEVVSGTGAASLLRDVPPWLGGALSALIVGVLLRLFDFYLRRREQRVTPPTSTH